MSTTIKAEFRWNKSVTAILRRRNLETGGLVQQTIDNAVIRYCEPYVPRQTGTLANSPYTVSEPGRVVYNTPYARYLYYGEVMGPNIPIRENGDIVGFYSPKNQKKELTGRPLHYNGEPQRGSFWFERMKADHTEDILREAQHAASKQH